LIHLATSSSCSVTSRYNLARQDDPAAIESRTYGRRYARERAQRKLVALAIDVAACVADKHSLT
jgi:hypothetical protein